MGILCVLAKNAHHPPDVPTLKQGSCEPEPDSWAPQAPFLVTYNYTGPNAERQDGHPSFIACRNRSGSEEGGGVRRELLTPTSVLGAMGGQRKVRDGKG